jgi:uncharacterized radical SAM superfamily protein
MSNLKEKLYKELEIKIDTIVYGINVNPAVFKHLDLGGKYQEEIHGLFEMDKESHVGINFPCSFNTPGGISINFHWDRKSPYSIEYEDGQYFLAKEGKFLFEIEFLERPDYYSSKTSDGVDMSKIALNYGRDGLFVVYSNECALKDKGSDCKFCNINATKDTYAEAEDLQWKTPKQIGETVAKAYKDGFKHVTISGGFVPERREVEYYIDVAESIKEETGLDDFNGTACIGAPKDLTVIEKYKEAGYRTIAMNKEVWDANIFKTICPGKVDQCGDHEHWVKAYKKAVEVFGFGRVRSTFVAGIEPKETLLEGLEYLASIGVAVLPSIWIPNLGSALEGHRSPEPEWHFDVVKKTYGFLKKAGITYDQYYDAHASAETVIHDIYRIEEELLPIFNK